MLSQAYEIKKYSDSIPCWIAHQVVIFLGQPNHNFEGKFTMRQTGTIKFFNQSRGYGFIKPDIGESDVFVHVTALEKSGLSELGDGTKVVFDTQDDSRGRGKQAINIELG